jgi:hypothetical protein
LAVITSSGTPSEIFPLTACWPVVILRSTCWAVRAHRAELEHLEWASVLPYPGLAVKTPQPSVIRMITAIKTIPATLNKIKIITSILSMPDFQIRT